MNCSNTSPATTSRPSQVFTRLKNAWPAALLAVLSCLSPAETPATAQTLQLRVPFSETHGSGTTSASDTSSGGISATMTLLNPAGTTAVDLHGAPGTGVTNNVQ